MGCRNVSYKHRILEFGKDIVYYKNDEYGDRVYTGIQVKKTKITAKDTSRILEQISEALGEPFTDNNGVKINLDNVVVLTSNEFSEESKDSMWAALRSRRENRFVKFIDGNKLVDLLTSNLPAAFWNEYDCFNKYFQAMKKDFETIKDVSAIGRLNPIPLEEIYVSMKLVESESIIEKEKSSENGGKLIKEELKKFDEESRFIKGNFDVEKALETFNKLIILGEPGSGKTTVLRHLSIKYCSKNIEKLERIAVPIPVSLRELLESKKDLRNYIDVIFEKYHFPQAKEFIENDLAGGKCILLLDGFDELVTKENQDIMSKCIQKFAKDYPKNKIVVTSRIAGYNDELKDFTKFKLVEFNEKQIKQFVCNWFGNDPAKAQELIKLIMRTKKIKKLVRNPLMIAIVAIIYEKDSRLPQKRAKLYERCVDVLINKWDEHRNVKNCYASEKKEFILKKLATYAHINNKKIMTEKEILSEIRKYSAQMQLKNGDAKPLLDEIWKRSYLLRQISMENYDFLHLSFQEYFTALELKEQDDGISKIIEHLHDPWWEEPILLYAGISNNATSLIRQLHGKEDDMFFSNLLILGKCVADTEFTDPKSKKEIIDDLWELYHNTEFKYLQYQSIDVLCMIELENVKASLIVDLKDQNEDIRGKAAISLCRIGDKNVLEPILNVFESFEDTNFKANIIFGIGLIGDELCVEPLLSILKTDEDEAIKMLTSASIGLIGDELCVEPLLSILKTDEDPVNRESAAMALGFVGGDEVVDPLLDVLVTDEDEDVRRNVALSIGRRGKDKLKPLLNKIKDYCNNIKIGIAIALGNTESEKAIKILLEVLSIEQDNVTKKNAIMALGFFGGDEVVEPLLSILKTDEDVGVRRSVVDALGQINDDNVLNTLKEALTDEKNKTIRNNIFNALRRLSKKKNIPSYKIEIKSGF